MPRFATFLTVAVVLIFVLIATSWAKQKEREWQTGKVLDTDRTEQYVGTYSSASGTSNASGTYGSASGLGVPIYRASGVYNIEAGEYIYVCHESLRWRTSKPAALTVNGPVQFSVEGDTLYLKDDNGREHKTKIVKKILKEPKAKQ